MKTVKKQSKAGSPPWLPSALLALLTLIAYGPVFRNALIDWDDYKYITENPLTQSLSPSNIVEMFSSPVMGNYHPLTMLSLAINFLISGSSPAGFHVTNLLLHIANTLLVLRLFSLMGLQFPGAYAGAILFALHPLHVESVAWAAERKDVLYTLFFLLAFINYLKFQSGASQKFYQLAILFFLLACLSKGMAVVLPAMLLAVDMYQNRKPDWKKLAPFFAMSLVFGIIAVYTQQIQGGIRAVHPYNLLERMLIVGNGFAFYLWKALIPFGLSAIYPYPPTGESLPISFTLFSVLTIALCISAWIVRKKYPIITWAILLYAIAIFPVLQWLPVGDAFAADRYFYVASLGILFMAGYGFEKWYQKNSSTAISLAAALTVALLVLTYNQSALWKDEIALFTHTVKNYPTAAVAYNNMGAIQQRKEQYGDAIYNYTMAIQYDPDYATALCNLGISYGRKGNLKEAMNYLEKAIKADSMSWEAYGNLGNAYAMDGKKEEAERMFLKALALRHDYFEANYNLGVFYKENKALDKAIQSFREGIKIKSDSPDCWWSLGSALFEKGDTTEAVNALRKAAGLGSVPARNWMKANRIM